MTDLPDLPDDTRVIGLTENNVDRTCDYCRAEAVAHAVVDGDGNTLDYAGDLCVDHIRELCTAEMLFTRDAAYPEDAGDAPDEGDTSIPLPEPTEDTQDGLTAFLNERLVGGDAGTLTVAAVHTMYERFCEAEGYQATSLPALAGHLTRWGSAKLESSDDDAEGLEQPILVTGVKPA